MKIRFELLPCGELFLGAGFDVTSWRHPSLTLVFGFFALEVKP